MARAAAKIKKKYKPLYTTDKRYLILTGGRGSGKTHAVQDLLIRLMEDVGQGILYTRYTMKSVKDTIIPLFLKYIDTIGDSRNYHTTATKVINKRTGSFIMFSGIKVSSKDQTGNLKSLPNINTWVVEEAEDYNRAQSFTDIDDSIRDKDKTNKIILILNPTTRHHFIYKRFFEGHHEKVLIENGAEWVNEDGEVQHSTYQKSTHPEVEHIHTTYYDNLEHLNEDKVKQWESIKETDPETWTNKYGGSWIDMPKGAVFKKVNWIEEFPSHITRISWGMDFGFENDPTTLIKCGTADGQLFAEMFVYEKGLIASNVDNKTTKNINDKLIGIGFNRKHKIIADSSHPITIKTLRLLKWDIKKAKKGQGSVVSGIDAIKTYGKLNIVYCKEWNEEQYSYIWDKNRNSENLSNNPQKGNDHLWDALRYGIQGLRRSTARTTVR